MSAAVAPGSLHLLKTALSLPFLGFLPGYILLRWVPPAARDRSGLGTLERVAVAVLLSLAITSVLALILAQVGRLHTDLLVVLLAGACMAAWRLAPDRAARSTPRSADERASVYLLCAVIVLAVTLFTPPFQATLWGADASLYVAYGVQIGRSGAYVFEDPLLSGIPLDAREELFRNQAESDMTGEHARFPGGIGFVDMAAGRVAPGFSPLFSIWVAMFAQLFGAARVFWASSFFGVCAVAAAFALGRSLQGSQAGLYAAMWMTVCMPQIWFSRLPMSETLSQLFLLGGVWTALLYLRKEDRILGMVSGALLGVAGLTGLDVVVVTTAGILAFAAVGLLAGRRIPHSRYFVAGYGAVTVYGLAHLAHYPSNYAGFFAERLPRLPLGALAVSILNAAPAEIWLAVGVMLLAAAAVGCAWLAPKLIPDERARERIAGLALTATVVLYVAGYAVASKPRFQATLRWFPAYLSWPLVVLFVAGLAGIVWRRVVVARDADASALLTAFAVASLPVVYNPQLQDFGVHPATMRRFVAFVIPGIFLISGVAFSWFTWRLSLYARSIVAPLGAGLVLALVAQPSMPLVGERLWDNGVTENDELAAMFPPNAVILVSPELAGVQAQAALTFWHERGGVALSRSYAVDGLVESQVIRWLRDGRDVFLLSGARSVHFDGSLLALLEHDRDEIVVRTLPGSSWIPDAVEARKARLTAYRFALDPSPRTHVDVGSYVSDAMFPMTGFYGPETDSNEGDYRWTGAVSSVEVPVARRVTLVLQGARPLGTPPAVVSIRANGELVVTNATLPQQTTRLAFDLPTRHPGKPTTLTIESSTFNPRRAGLSDDGRELGVRLYRIDFER